MSGYVTSTMIQCAVVSYFWIFFMYQIHNRENKITVRLRTVTKYVGVN